VAAAGGGAHANSVSTAGMKDRVALSVRACVCVRACVLLPLSKEGVAGVAATVHSLGAAAKAKDLSE
jgi:hypothetical protein